MCPRMASWQLRRFKMLEDLSDPRFQPTAAM